MPWSALPAIGEELPSGQVKCRLCNTWCVSWHGLLVHYQKKHVVKKPKPMEAKKALTLWDLRYGGKRWDQSGI
jgi:hypothetical protein